MNSKRLIILPGGKFLPGSQEKEDPLVKVFTRAKFEVETITYSDPPDLKEDLTKLIDLLTSQPQPFPSLLGISRGGYLSYCLLVDYQLFTKVVICSAPFDLGKWPFFLLRKKWQDYFSINPAELSYSNLPSTLLIYGTKDPIVPASQGALAFAGLRRQLDPRIKKPNILLAQAKGGGHSIAYSPDALKSIIYWLRKP